MKILALPLAVSLLAVACGGKVAVDEGGATSTSTSTSGSVCVDACNKVAAACGNADPAECTTSCAKLDPIFEAACPDLYEAWMQCIDDDPSAQCSNTSTACQAEIAAFTPCLTTACSATPSPCQ